MHGILTGEHRTTREVRPASKSSSKSKSEIPRKAHLHIAATRRDTGEVIPGSEQRAPQHDPGRSPSASGSSAGRTAIRPDDGHLCLYNGSTYDTGNMLRSDPDRHQLFRNGIIHDLGNLLQVLSSGVSIAENRIGQGHAEDVPDILRKLGGSVEKASALLRQMVRIPRAPANRISGVDIAEMLTTLDAPLHWALGPGCELAIAIAPNLPPVYCVESEFENVILNLVINARDAMPTGGRVTIEAARSTRTGAGAGVVLRVHDTGMGMNPDVAGKAFRPYFTTKSAAAGTGLGLATVAAFALSLGGTARIERTSTKGTTIALHLPNPRRT